MFCLMRFISRWWPAPPGSVAKAGSSRLFKKDLAHIDGSNGETGLAIAEVIFPHAPKRIIKAALRNLRPCRAETVTPLRQRAGVIQAKGALADDVEIDPGA